MRCAAVAQRGSADTGDEFRDYNEEELDALAEQLLGDEQNMLAFTQLAATRLMAEFPDEMMIVFSDESRSRFVQILQAEVGCLSRP